MRYCLNKTKGPEIGAFCTEKPEIVYSVFSIAPQDDIFLCDHSRCKREEQPCHLQGEVRTFSNNSAVSKKPQLTLGMSRKDTEVYKELKKKLL